MGVNVITLPLQAKTTKGGGSSARSVGELMPEWLFNLLEKHKAKQNELTRKKISALQQKAYDYYLTLYIDRIIKFKEVDFHPDLYLSGAVVCTEAKRNAANEVIRIIKQGEKAINRCYSILLENNRHNERVYG